MNTFQEKAHEGANKARSIDNLSENQEEDGTCIDVDEDSICDKVDDFICATDVDNDGVLNPVDNCIFKHRLKFLKW